MDKSFNTMNTGYQDLCTKILLWQRGDSIDKRKENLKGKLPTLIDQVPLDLLPGKLMDLSISVLGSCSQDDINSYFSDIGTKINNIESEIRSCKASLLDLNQKKDELQTHSRGKLLQIKRVCSSITSLKRKKKELKNLKVQITQSISHSIHLEYQRYSRNSRPNSEISPMPHSSSSLSSSQPSTSSPSD